MFDIGWSEILVIAVVAVVVVGPKELPSMLRTFGRTMGQVRKTANGFRRQFDEAMREVERQADLEETKKSLQSAVKLDELADIKNDLMKEPDRAAPSPSPEPTPPPSVTHEAEPLKVGPVASEQNSDAA
jgi:sec-independent protein translocase protein TatB